MLEVVLPGVVSVLEEVIPIEVVSVLEEVVSVLEEVVSSSVSIRVSTGGGGTTATIYSCELFSVIHLNFNKTYHHDQQ